MSLTAAEILQVLERAKELGVTSVEVEGFKAQIPLAVQPTAPAETVEDFKPEDAMAALDPWSDLSEEEITYWSCPHGGALEEEKKRKQDLANEQRRFDASEKE